MEENWIKGDISLQYHECLPPHAENVVPKIIEYYREKNPESKNGKVPIAFDLACGPGSLSEILGDYCDTVVASDVSPFQVAGARQMSTHSNVSYHVASVFEISKLLGSEKADLITSSNASHYFNTKQFYDEVRRCLRYGGVLAETVFLIVAFPELPQKAFDEHFEFVCQIVTNYGKYEEYNRKFDHVINGYKTMKCHLEESELIHFTFDHLWTKDQMQRLMIYINPKAEAYSQKICDFYSKLWSAYDIGEHLKMRVRVSTLYSRNLSPENTHDVSKRDL